jgi:DNA-binding GntR family transcriptional regulator
MSATWTSVSLPYVTGEHRDSWAAEAAEHGGTGAQKLLEVTEVVPPADVATALNLEPGEAAVVRRRLMLFNEQPVELTDSYYPASIARGTPLAEFRKIRGGAVSLLADLGYTPRHAREDVAARLAVPAERAVLRLGDNECVLLLSRLLITEKDQPIEASVMTMVATGRRLRYQLSV